MYLGGLTSLGTPDKNIDKYCKRIFNIFHTAVEVKLLSYSSCQQITEEPSFNEPLYNEVLGITIDFLQPGQNYSKMYGT